LFILGVFNKEEEQMTISRLLVGIVVESKTPSPTGEYLYSDFAIKNGIIQKNSSLNNLTQVPFMGIVAGVWRIALGILHSLGHLFAYFVTKAKGHLYHAAKGGCEMLRGAIEAIPLIGRVFAWLYMFPSSDGRCWWMIKMYNPNSPDGLDRYMDNWASWKVDAPHLYFRV
jgi:hypothetical protein